MGMLHPTTTPGEFIDLTSGQVQRIVEQRIDDRMDTEVTASGAITANTQEDYFINLSVSGNKKQPIDANFPQPNKICNSIELMYVERLWLDVPLVVGNTDLVGATVKRVLENLYLSWKLNTQVISEGPAKKYPPGYGITGQTTENNASIVSNGVPSMMAQVVFPKPYRVGENTHIEVTGVWYDRLWDATNMATLATKAWTRAGFHGLIESAAAKNV